MRSRLALLSAFIIAPALLFISVRTFQTLLSTPSPNIAPSSSPSIKDTEPDVFSPTDYGPNCFIRNTCNNLVELDCQSTADGSTYYIDILENKVLQTCGGDCMTNSNEAGVCEECPPQAWQTCLNNKAN